MISYKKLVSATVFTLLLANGTVPLATAVSPQSSSSNYRVNEVQFGAGGSLHDCSANYCAKTSAGETVVGNSKGINYQAQGGFNTDRTPYLEFNVSGSDLNLGVLGTSSTKTANATFSVKTYLANGYVITTESDSPKNGTHLLQPLSSPTASIAGTEQFGINLVANTAPVTFGGGPVQVPSNSFSFGAVASGYNTPNVFKYQKGDVVATSTKSSGETDYTISYILNSSNVTPGGTYTMQHTLVATSTF